MDLDITSDINFPDKLNALETPLAGLETPWQQEAYFREVFNCVVNFISKFYRTTIWIYNSAIANNYNLYELLNRDSYHMYCVLHCLQEPVPCIIGRHVDEKSHCVVEDCAVIIPLLDALEAFLQVDDILREVRVVLLCIY